jgi:putative transposase
MQDLTPMTPHDRETMARPLRIEFPGALYHVTSRGDRREPIYRRDDDRRLHLAIIGQALQRFGACLWAYCLMPNHYHLVLQTPLPNLSRAMRHINGVYTQAFNRRHGVAGHLFQGRFKAILVDGDAYLLTLCRYVERNPVAAGLVQHAEDWPWSSCRSHLGATRPMPGLDTDSLHALLLGRTASTRADRIEAVRRYRAMLDEPSHGARNTGVDFWSSTLRQQIFMGDDRFVCRMQEHMRPELVAQVEIPRQHRRSPAAWAADAKRRDLNAPSSPRARGTGSAARRPSLPRRARPGSGPSGASSR